MRKLSITTFVIFLLTWGFYRHLQLNTQLSKVGKNQTDTDEENIDEDFHKSNSILSKTRKNELDQIAAVINSKNVKIDKDAKKSIQEKRVSYDNKKDLKNLTAILEQSYIDKNGTVKDIIKIQNKIAKLKKEMDIDVLNTEKWDPLLVYYLMIQDNYTYKEINQIYSLSDNGISKDELDYIGELTRGEEFARRIANFKNSEDANRSIASQKNLHYKEKDEYQEGSQSDVALEDKLIEMNYNDNEIMEIRHGYNQ